MTIGLDAAVSLIAGACRLDGEEDFLSLRSSPSAGLRASCVQQTRAPDHRGFVARHFWRRITLIDPGREKVIFLSSAYSCDTASAATFTGVPRDVRQFDSACK